MIEWQPISTAPKDGTLILAWLGSFELSWWEHGMWLHMFDGYGEPYELTDITHWMPLPSPPEQAND